MNWRPWLYSIATAGIGGAASSLGGAVLDPAFFNFTTGGLIHIAQLALFGAAIPVFAILKQSPLPALTVTTTSTATVTQEVTKS
jgi:hypothetical protein